MVQTYLAQITGRAEDGERAREELRHFEQVQRLMRELGVSFKRMSPARYAEGLRRAVHRDDPQRLLDLLICDIAL